MAQPGTACIDFAPLVVGLQSEREPGTSVGVTYRLFTRPRRSFIVADAQHGHRGLEC